MTIKSYFFNAVQNTDGSYDRTYNAEDFTSYLDLIVGSGVFPNPTTQLQVQASTGMQVIVKAGTGWINGYKMVSNADTPYTVANADVLLDRIDRVVFYVDYSARTMGIDIIQGTPASTPTAPALQRDSTRYEMGLATIAVAAQATAITASMITDTRPDSSVCGWVSALIEQIDATGLFSQFQGEFDEWLATVRETLATTTLLTKFEYDYTTTAASESTFNIVNYIPRYNYALDILEIRINGLSLSSSEYTRHGSIVTLATPITETGTLISFVVYKSIDGSGAESIVDTVDEMKVYTDALASGMYVASGENDNIKLSNVVRAFLTGTKNQLQNTLSSQTINGLTVTVNSDGSVTVNGTATADTVLLVGSVGLEAGTTYALTGCPDGGGSESYALNFRSTVFYDYGNGCDYTPSSARTQTVSINVYSGAILQNVVFYPMVRYAYINDATYEPYDVTSTSDYKQLEIDVYGDMACTTPAATVNSVSYWFNFWAAKSTRRVKLNFAHCSRIIVDNTGISNAVLISAADTEIANLQAVMNNCTAATMIENSSTCTDCAFWMNAASNSAGSLAVANQGTFTNCRASVTAGTGTAYGFSANGNVLRLTNCEVLAYNASSASAESVAVHVQANQTNNVLIMDGCSCPITARNGYKQSNTVKINSGFYYLSGNMLGKAALKYSTGDGMAENGTMIVSK